MGIELVAGEHPAHRVTPAGHLMQAQCGATEGEDAALHFHLREAGVAGAQVDIGGQHQLDTDGEAVTLGGDDHRLADPGPGKHSPRVAAAGRGLPAFAQCRAGIDQVQAGGEMFAMTEDHGHPCFAVGLELTVGQAQFIEQVQIKGVALGDPVQSDHQDMTALFTAHAAGIELFHAAFPRAGDGRADPGFVAGG
ncbi:hypothetical protein D3C84_863780 [compost metagenome]